MNKQEALKWCVENLEEWGKWPKMSRPTEWAWITIDSGSTNLVGRVQGCIGRDEWQAAREEYLAKQKPQWNGKGLPPVGVECEAMLNGRWQKCEILKTKANSSEIEVAACDFGKAGLAWSADFRPIRTDREKAIDALVDNCKSSGGNIIAGFVVDALDAGKIPGYGKLEK